MNQSPSSGSSLSPPVQPHHLSPPLNNANRSGSAISLSKGPHQYARGPAIIPLNYDYRIMSPSTSIATATSTAAQRRPKTGKLPTSASTATRSLFHARPIQVVQQLEDSDGSSPTAFHTGKEYSYNSLFGDPVPPPAPPPDVTMDLFNGRRFDAAVASLSRQNSIVAGRLSVSSEESSNGSANNSNIFGRTYTRLFPSVPYTSVTPTLTNTSANPGILPDTHHNLARAGSAFVMPTPRERRRSSTLSEQSNFKVLPTPMPRLQPPDIQILPNSNSSAGSSEGNRDSPNFALLTPQDIMRKPGVYDLGEPGDVSELNEVITINDAQGRREYSEATRRVSDFSEDFKSNVGSSVSNFAPAVMPIGRLISNESYSSNDWFHPAIQDFPEFSKMPGLRPSSKNVMSIRREDILLPSVNSPVAAMINNSTASSSPEGSASGGAVGGQERLLDVTQTLEHPSVCLEGLPPVRPPDPSPARMRQLQRDLQSPTTPTPLRRRKSSTTPTSIEESDMFTPSPQDQLAPPRPPSTSPPLSMPTERPASTPTVHDFIDVRFDEDTATEYASSQQPLRSPVIMRDYVSTGSDYRVEEPSRLHKKTSFTIIADRSPHSSHHPSPTATLHHHQLHREKPAPAQRVTSTQNQGEQRSTSSTPSGGQPIAKPRRRLQQKSLTSLQLRLPRLSQTSTTTPSESQRPSVQFNMSGGRYSPSKQMPPKGILMQHSSSPEILTGGIPQAAARRRPSTLGLGLREEQTLPSPHSRRGKSYETLPLVTDPFRTAIPRLNVSQSHGDLARRESVVFPPGALPRPLKPNPNPTRKQRGLLRILNGKEASTRIPQRTSWSTSMDDLSTVSASRRPSMLPTKSTSLSIQEQRRRSSSTSPERRSSTQTVSDRRSSNLSSITTSDFSFRRPSMLPKVSLQRKKSIALPARFVAKGRQSLAPAGGTGSTGSEESKTTGRRTRIARPSPLSPIIGTPNKDSSTPQSPAQGALALGTAIRGAVGRGRELETPSEGSSSRRDSISSRIPVRNGGGPSVVGGSLVPGSRSTSPLKEFTAQLPLSSGRTSQATSSRSPSRASQQSKVPSRSTSRASTRPMSRGAPSRSGSRPNSRQEQARDIANSRSNSRLSLHSLHQRTGSVSPSIGMRQKASTMMTQPKGYPNRRKSISLSPRAMRRSDGRKLQVVSPTRSLRRSSSRLERVHSSRSRIPQRAKSGKAEERWRVNTTSSVSPGSNRTSTSRRNSPQRQSPAERGSTSRGTGEPVRRSRSSASGKTKTSPTGRKTTSSAKTTPAAKRKTTPSSSSNSASKKSTPGSVQRSTSNLKREKSNVQARSSAGAGGGKPIKREVSSLSLRKPTTASGSGGSVGATPGRKTATKTPAKASAKTPSTAEKAKKAVDEKAKRATPPKSGESAAATIASAAAVGTVEINSSAEVGGRSESATGTPTAGGGMKRNPSKMTLLRMGSRLSLLSKKRSDSSLSKRSLAEHTLAEEPTTPKDSKDAEMAAALTTQLNKLAGGVDEAASMGDGTLPSVILEKSQQTLKSVQKTVTEATDEIQKTIHENLSDLKNLEQDMGKISDVAASPTSSVATVVENKAAKTTGSGGESVSRGGTAAGAPQKSPQPPTQPIEAAVSVVSGGTAAALAVSEAAEERVSARAISVLPEVDCDSANLQKYALDIDGSQISTTEANAVAALDGVLRPNGGGKNVVVIDGGGDGSTDDFNADGKRRSPDGQGGSTMEGAERTGSQEEFLANQAGNEDDPKSPGRGCCSCCARFCMPCRRSRCSRCCFRRRNGTDASLAVGGDDEAKRPVLSATSSATTTNLEVIDERQPGTPAPTDIDQQKQGGCWQKLNCCKRCRKQKSMSSEEAEHMKAESMAELKAGPSMGGPPRQSKCGLCLSKIFCCRSVNKVEAISGVETEVKKCCFCIPCRSKRTGDHQGSRTGSVAWQDPEAGITPTDASVVEGAGGDIVPAQQGCCKRFWNKILCCRKKPPPTAGSRRMSMRAPPPPSEDTRRKLHVDLVEYNSKMKGAIPVLPIFLAWFCAICNVGFPGLGTLFSGVFCLCVGIPRFSQYDSAPARIGSFIINVIVAVSQFCCVLFCCVGWGWSIWWGTIMLRCARKLKRIKKVERLELEEERRQAEAEAAAAANIGRGPIHVSDAELSAASGASATSLAASAAASTGPSVPAAPKT